MEGCSLKYTIASPPMLGVIQKMYACGQWGGVEYECAEMGILCPAWPHFLGHIHLFVGKRLGVAGQNLLACKKMLPKGCVEFFCR